MKARLVQKSITDLDIRRHLDLAGAAEIDLICFGELAGTGCRYARGEAPSLEYWLELCDPYPFGVMLGSAIKDRDGLRNDYLFIRHGMVQIYTKINLFPDMNEPDVYRAGREPGLWETGFGKTGVTICYDLRFADLYTGLAKSGATTILVPAAFPRVRIADWKHLLVQRARDNRVRILGINAVGNDGTNEFGGSTMVVEPDGLISFQADETSPVTIDLEF